MNPSYSSESGGLNLPPIVESQPPAAGFAVEAPAAVSEMSPAVPPAAMPVQTTPPPVATLPQVTTTTTVDDVSNTTTAAAPTSAKDEDLIEKEWVAKAKQIIDRTREDPHEQSKELNTFKAEYVQKRFNKVLKISE